MATAREATRDKRARQSVTGAALTLWLASIMTACQPTGETRIDASSDAAVESSWPSGDAAAGQTLFVAKGCVLCHSVNDVGGRAALPLDAPPPGTVVDPMVFAAAMWQGAYAMLSLQFTELGYQIGLTGEELRDLAAFASDPTLQADFSIEDVPPELRPWIIDTPYWLDDGWPEPYEAPPEDMPSPFEDL